MSKAQQNRLASFLVLAGVAACSVTSSAIGSAQASQSAQRRLTSASPDIRLPLPTSAAPSPVIVLRVAAIRNPGLAPLTLDVALAPCSASDKRWTSEHLASLGVYPPDEPTSYSVPVTKALGRLRGRSITNLNEICLQVRLRPLREHQPADAVEVTLAPPAWRNDK